MAKIPLWKTPEYLAVAKTFCDEILKDLGSSAQTYGNLSVQGNDDRIKHEILLAIGNLIAEIQKFRSNVVNSKSPLENAARASKSSGIKGRRVKFRAFSDANLQYLANLCTNLGKIAEEVMRLIEGIERIALEGRDKADEGNLKEACSKLANNLKKYKRLKSTLINIGGSWQM
ncbi:hypothetical protein HYY72_04750 [Candidatus Woesearchaeota archaeon]|nr:hypothetical protein [Candidatus Woesearchaeota archaeon]